MLAFVEFIQEIHEQHRAFKTDHYEGTLYKCSLYFIGAKLWDTLPVNVIEVPCIVEFKKRTKRANKKYVNSL